MQRAEREYSFQLSSRSAECLCDAKLKNGEQRAFVEVSRRDGVLPKSLDEVKGNLPDPVSCLFSSQHMAVAGRCPSGRHGLGLTSRAMREPEWGGGEVGYSGGEGG